MKSRDKVYSTKNMDVKNKDKSWDCAIGLAQLDGIKPSKLSTKEKKERKQARCRKYYRNKLSQEGKQTKENQVKDRQKAIWMLLKEGEKQVEICQKLNISRSTFYADKKIVECSLDALPSGSKSIEEYPHTQNMD